MKALKKGDIIRQVHGDRFYYLKILDDNYECKLCKSSGKPDCGFSDNRINYIYLVRIINGSDKDYTKCKNTLETDGIYWAIGYETDFWKWKKMSRDEAMVELL